MFTTPPGTHMIVSCLHSSFQGVRHKVIAFEGFLERYPEFQGQVVLIQVALARTEQNELQASITDVISHVNSRFGSLTYQPVVLLHTQDITFPMYLGLLSAADAFMVTSLREGMALRTHEFVECQHERKRPLILSEVRSIFFFSLFCTLILLAIVRSERFSLTFFLPCLTSLSSRARTRIAGSGPASLLILGITGIRRRLSTKRLR